MVFQNYALWPHMTVAQNVAYGLDVRSVAAAEKRDRVAEALAIVQMEKCRAFAEPALRRATAARGSGASAGDQARCAFARRAALNLDAKLRLEMREEIRRIHAQTKITTIYVTHDEGGVVTGVAHGGAARWQSQQIGDPRTVYRSPANRFVADFISETNWFQPGEIGFFDRSTGGDGARGDGGRDESLFQDW
jgi:ABC-type Fe3+/spermidine/putrescine transport system ATPase subunit